MVKDGDDGGERNLPIQLPELHERTLDQTKEDAAQVVFHI
jgi:hypothetical protein